MTARALLADAGTPLTGATAFSTWQFAPVVTGLLITAAVLYAWGVMRVRRRHPARPWPVPRTASFIAGLVVVALATQSSIGAYDDQLFWIHMVQHLLLIMVAPTLLVVGRPVMLLLHASRNPVHRTVQRVLRSRTVSALTWPPVAFAGYTAVIVGTHLTSFMNTTLEHPLIHDAEHALYLVAGYLFFLPLIGSEPIRWRLAYPTRLFWLVLAMPVDTFTGLTLSFTNHELFPAYARVGRHWGPGLVDDLHAGGAVMWIGGDALMLALILVLLLDYLHRAHDAGTAGSWLEAARATTLATRVGTAGVNPPTARGTTIDDDAHLAAYNTYLATLSARQPAQPGDEVPKPASREQ